MTMRMDLVIRFDYGRTVPVWPEVAPMDMAWAMRKEKAMGDAVHRGDLESHNYAHFDEHMTRRGRRSP